MAREKVIKFQMQRIQALENKIEELEMQNESLRLKLLDTLIEA